MTGEDKRTQAAVDAAQQWLEMVDSGRFLESWEQAAALFKNAVTEAQWRESMERVKGMFGDQRSRNFKSAKYATELPGAPDGEYVVIEFETAFEHKQNAVETVTPMKDPDGEWRVSGYYIR